MFLPDKLVKRPWPHPVSKRPGTVNTAFAAGNGLK
jgi:hypothetical protein